MTPDDRASSGSPRRPSPVTEHAPVDEPNDASFVNMRRHGPRGTYDRGYPPQRIAADADHVRGWRAAGRTVYAYYNNDAHAHAPRDARRLLDALEEPSRGT